METKSETVDTIRRPYQRARKRHQRPTVEPNMRFNHAVSQPTNGSRLLRGEFRANRWQDGKWPCSPFTSVSHPFCYRQLRIAAKTADPFSTMP